MRLKPNSVHSNANVQDRQLGETEKREVSANMQDSLRAEEAGVRARSKCTTILELTLQAVLQRVLQLTKLRCYPALWQDSSWFLRAPHVYV
ncbi:hypothetical protein BK133_30855, partial [Paenibacillus sp. FSL H8-0548]